MKITSLLVIAAGILSLLLGFVERAFNTFILGIAPTNFLGLAATLFLLALALIEFDRSYQRIEKKP
ncbi:MAG: hypothetical protein EHM61_17955 [Acidobacteria bacterium]|nr:MAG: hypothetical protein EHM61_17955 [Acidobacteriota bacterium]